MAAPKPPVIVVPGITATVLRDEYPVEAEPVWKVIGKEWERVFLHPDDLRYERDEPAVVRPDAVFPIPYREFIEELRHDLSEKADEPVPVFPFPYDWRQPLRRIQEELSAFIDEVMARTALLRHYHKGDYGEDPKVDLVGHSMGGLVIAGLLADAGQAGDARVRKVATLGSPFRGSFEAVIKVAVGTAALGLGEESSRDREAARLTPALYHLIPSIEGGLKVAEGLPEDLYDADLWQDGVIATIGEYIRLHGLDAPRAKRDREARAKEILQGILDGAREHRDSLESLRLERSGLSRDDWLAVVGVGEKTRTELRIENDRGDPWFDLASAGRKNGYPEPERDDAGEIVVNLWETGDGTVPYAGARAAFVPLESVVCVSTDDFGYWEIGDKLLEKVGVGLHGMLPEMNVVRKLVAAHLKGDANEKGRAHPGVWGRRAPDLARNADWDPPLKGLREKEP